MNNLIKTGALNSIGVLVYIAIVSQIIENGDRLFGKMDNWLGPIAFLLLFTLSALVVGALVLGKPLMLYLDGDKKDAVSLLGIIIGFLALFTIIALLIAYFLK